MKKHFTIKSCLAALSLALGAQTSVQAQQFVPIPLTPNSFTYQIVVPSNYPPMAVNAETITVTLDNGPVLTTNVTVNTITPGTTNGGSITVTNPPYVYLSGNTMFEIGLDPGARADGVPLGGSMVTNVTMSDHIYQMPYWTNASSNCVFIGNYNNPPAYTGGTNLRTGAVLYTGQNYTSATLTMNDPTLYTALSLVNSTGNGPCDANISITHADGTTEGPYPVSFADWFNTSGASGAAATNTSVSPNPTAAYDPSGRLSVAPGNGFANIGSVTGSRMWATDIGLSDTTSPITSISFTYTGGGRTAIFAVSGTVNPASASPGNTVPLAGPFNPVAGLAGFNAGCVVPCNHLPLPYNATMDSGTNYITGGGNTWAEQGWDLQSTNGFPVHNSTFTSFSNPNRTYQMAPTYSQNMSVLIDTNHQSSSITPMTPLAFTAISFLTAGANNGTFPMTNYCILQHSDGVNESNVFLGYDWFQSGIPYAWIANSRADLSGGYEMDNNNSGDPRLFESAFQTSDGTPVTNMIVGFYKSQGNGSTTFILGISGTTNFVIPEITNYTVAQNVYAGQTATYSVAVGLGSHPTPGYQWQVTDTATFTNNLANGSGPGGSTIAGATSPTLTISGVSSANSVNNSYAYQCVITNPGVVAVSTPAPLTLLVSTATNIVQPTDAISDFYGAGDSPGEAVASPAGLTLNYVIDGTDEQYLNYGASGSTAQFQGPVGFVVHPSAGPTVVTALRWFTPVNAANCDPADFELEGSLDGVNWTTIVPDRTLSLPNERNILQTAPVDVTNQVMEEVDFANSTSYEYYRVTIQNVKNNLPGTPANSLQIGELQFLGSPGHVSPEILTEPGPVSADLAPGGSLTFDVGASGAGPITYQWYLIANNTTNAVSGAINASYSIPPVGSSGSASYYVVASNPYGSVTSSIVSYTVVPSTSSYETTVLDDHPIALLRLDDAPSQVDPYNDGIVAQDIVGGHNGVYSNTILQQPGYSTNGLDTDNYSAEFGQYTDPALNGTNGSTSLPQDNMVTGISGLNFATAPGGSTNFSIEAWVNLNANTVAGAGVVSEGWGGGGDEFALDMGGTGNDFRFYVRNSADASTTVSGNVAPALGTWYYVVGVLDESSNVESIYVNGELAASADLAPDQGVLNSNFNFPVVIGSRQSASSTNYNDQLNGFVADVAVYDYALTGAQVLNHYLASGPAPFFTVQPTNLSVDVGQPNPAVFSSQAVGLGGVTYQWYYNGSVLANGASPSGTGAVISGATSSNLTITHFTANDNGENYSVVASNANGVTLAPASGSATLTVNSGPAVLGTDLTPLLNVGPIGTPFEYVVVASGTAPFTYTWYQNGSLIAGATTSTYSNLFTVGTNTFYVAVSNTISGGTAGFVSSTATNIGTIGVSPVLFPVTGSNGWTINDTGAAPPAGSNVLANGQLTLTFNLGSETRDAWYNVKQNIGEFSCSYTYIDLTPGTGGADGVTFTVQNEGLSAIGGGGGEFAYVGITPSACFAQNIYHGAGASANLDADTVMFGVDGVTPASTPPMEAAAPVVPDGGDPIQTTIFYDGHTLTATIEDTVTKAVTTISTQIDLVSIVGSPAYIGFTGADGGAEATQQIRNFTFANGVLPPTLTTSLANGNITLAWPSSTSTLYVLQTAPTVLGPWTSITSGLNGVGAQIQYTTPATQAAAFYRLVLQ